MRLLLVLAGIIGGRHAHAQYQASPWLHVDYTYNDFSYKEPSMNEKAQLAGVKGEVGFNVLGLFALSLAGEYADGHTNYDGATFDGTAVKQVTKDYLGDLRAMAHIVYGPVVLSGGVAERYWMNNLVVSYRRRTVYNYTPLQLTYFATPFYVRFEQDLWGSGHNRSYMSDVNASEHDVEFKLGTVTGIGGEIGIYLPGALVQTHLFLRYHKWTVKQSDVQNDGVYNLVEPDNNTSEIVAGIGLAF